MNASPQKARTSAGCRPRTHRRVCRADLWGRRSRPASTRRTLDVLAGRSRTEHGLTLIEIMIVVAIFALVATGVSMGVGALYRTQLRSSAVDIASAARFAYHRAVVRSSTVRIVLDMGAHAISVEEAHGDITLDMSENREVGEDDESAVDPWAAAEAELGQSQQAHVGRSAFAIIADDDGEPLARYSPRRFPVTDSRVIPPEGPTGTANVRITRLFSPHEEEPRESGKGYIYFFAGGLAEHAVVQITDENDNVYSVEIQPLTGRGKVYSYAYEPEDLDDEDEDLRDPG